MSPDAAFTPLDREHSGFQAEDEGLAHQEYTKTRLKICDLTGFTRGTVHWILKESFNLVPPC